MSNQELDVAIVGGGVSGLYSGWRILSSKYPKGSLLRNWAGPEGKLKVGVFEGSKRWGGRLLSARPPGMPHITCEIGGMRFVSSQTLIKSLVENKLNLTKVEQAVDEPSNLAYLRGTHLRYDELADPDKLPYNLSAAERQWLTRMSTNPSALLSWAIAQLLPRVNDLSGPALYEYLQSASIDGVPLYEHGFWNLLARVLSSEAYMLARATIGYDVLGSNANAVDLVREYFDFTPSSKYYLTENGYEQVPWMLKKMFRRAGGKTFKNRWLESFDSTTLGDGSEGVVLRFSNGDTIRARAIVLAMPRRSLELLKPTGPVLDPQRSPEMRFLMNSVEPVSLYKLNICYEYPWWENQGVQQGRTLTDIPVRQCYYWGSEATLGGDPANMNSTIMAYDDQTNASFWGGLRHMPLGPGDHQLSDDQPGGVQRPFQGRAPQRGEGEQFADKLTRRLRRNWDEHQAPEAMVKEIHRQLKLIHNTRYAPEPYAAAFKDWSDDPYGGGVHFWNVGYKSWEVLHQMIQPVDDVPCYVIGEAYSTNQTWAEGALQTAELMLQDKFGLTVPEWVKP